MLTELIEENIRKEKEKLFFGFADLKATFDKLRRRNIGKIKRKKSGRKVDIDIRRDI